MIGKGRRPDNAGVHGEDAPGRAASAGPRGKRSLPGPRWAWIVGASGVAAALVAAGGWLISLPLVSGSGLADYRDEAYPQAAQTFYGQRVFNLIDPWKPYYNAGTAAVQTTGRGSAGTWARQAVGMLETAYAKATGESDETKCAVQTNLSIAYEVRAGQKRDRAARLTAALPSFATALAAKKAGGSYDSSVMDEFTTEFGDTVTVQSARDGLTRLWSDAQDDYAAATQARQRPGCPTADLSKEREKQQKEAKERLQSEQQKAQDEIDKLRDPQPTQSPTPSRSPSPTDSPSASGSPTPSGSPTQKSSGSPSPTKGSGGSGTASGSPGALTPEQKRLKQLEEKAKKAEEEAEKDRQNADDYFGTPTPGSGYIKQW